MKLIDKLDRYLFETTCQIVIKDNSINIINYDEIIDFSLTKISIKCQNKIVVIDGRELLITKMLDNEVLIKGIINNLRIN